MIRNHRRASRDGSDDDDYDQPLTAHEQLIEGGTPLVELKRVSRLIGRSVFVKMESMNPGGTGKDRAALSMIRQAEREGKLPPPAGTSGSTGIALATLCAARGHACLVVLPDDQAVEKQRILRSLGAVVYEVPTAAISNPKHYVNLGRKAAALARDRFGVSAVFVDQFENLSNFDVHYRTTGPELVRQLRERGRGGLDAFVMSSGTGGTIAGIATYLKEQQQQQQQQTTTTTGGDVRIVLVDPPGSALYHKVEHGVAFAVEQKERYLRKHRYDTLAEGIGLDRITRNFASGFPCIDRSFRVTDQEAVDAAHWILRTEGLWIGSSSAMNIVGAVRTALELPEGSVVVTIVCDGGQRHATRFWNPKFIEEWGLRWPGADCVPECLRSRES
eukprot:jgi/Psemu1/295354/fgenesh1_pm.61_\